MDIKQLELPVGIKGDYIANGSTVGRLTRKMTKVDGQKPCYRSKLVLRQQAMSLLCHLEKLS